MSTLRDLRNAFDACGSAGIEPSDCLSILKGIGLIEEKTMKAGGFPQIVLSHPTVPDMTVKVPSTEGNKRDGHVNYAELSTAREIIKILIEREERIQKPSINPEVTTEQPIITKDKIQAALDRVGEILGLMEAGGRTEARELRTMLKECGFKYRGAELYHPDSSILIQLSETAGSATGITVRRIREALDQVLFVAPEAGTPSAEMGGVSKVGRPDPDRDLVLK